MESRGKGRTASTERFGNLQYPFGRRSFVISLLLLSYVGSMLYFGAIEKSKNNNVISSKLFRKD